MTRANQARKLLHQYGKTGNWRFKGLLLAALSDTPVSLQDVAEAWPTKRGEYRFLQHNPDYDAEHCLQEQYVAEEDTPEHHMLTQYAGDVVDEHDRLALASGRKDEVIQHCLFAAATVEEVDTLFRDQLADVVADGAQRAQQARNGAFIFNADTRNGTVPVGEDGAYNYESGSGGHAEGAIIPDDREDFTTVSWSCKKVGVGARITDEMVEHSMIDLIERQIQWVGRTTENDINRIWINELVDNANQSFNAGGSDLGVPAVNGAVGQVDDQDFEPDTFVSHSELRTELFDDSNLVYVNRSGRDMELREREVDRVMGLTHLPMNGSAHDSTSETWGYSAAGEVGAVVYERDKIWLVIHKDIEIKDYEDPIRDLQGVNSRAWVDSTYAQTDAAAQVIHS